MTSGENEILANKISDLTDSLYRTTDVLSSADRMIDHYRDLNRENEHEIARLQRDLHHINRNPHDEKAMLDRDKQRNHKSHSNFKKARSSNVSDISSMEEEFAKSPKRKSSTVRFQYENQPSKIDLLESSMNNISQRQSTVEQELNNERSMERDFNRMDMTLHKELLSMKNENRSQQLLDVKLRNLQDKIDHDHEKWKAQHKEIKNIAYEMSSLKEVVKEATTPKKAANWYEDEHIEAELLTYKRKVFEDNELISTLQNQLRRSTKENAMIQSSVEEMKNIGTMKANQLKLLEHQLEQEKQERNELQKNFYIMQNKADDVEKERTELLNQLLEMKTEVKLKHAALEPSFQNVPELKVLFERSERQRDKLSEHIYKLKIELESKDCQLDRLLFQVDEKTKKLSYLNAEKTTLISQAEMDANRYLELRRELDSLSTLLKETDLKLKECEQSRQQLKEKAVNTLKEYRLKCRKYEQRVEDMTLNHKNTEVKLAKEYSKSKEMEISNLKLQKEHQELACKLQHFKQQLDERDKQLSILSEEKNHVEHALSEASVFAKQTEELKREIQDLQNEKFNLNSQLLDEKRRRKEFDALLRENYEKQVAAKDETSLLQRQLKEDRESRAQLVARLQEENQSSTEAEVKRIESKTRILEDDKNVLLDKVQKLESLQEDFSRSMANLDKEKEERLEKERRIVLRLKKVTDENIRMRKQYRTMKRSYDEKIQAVESTVTMEKDQKNILQSHIKNYQTANSKVKDSVGVLMNITMRDAENLLNLLCREDEDQLPVKEIPDSILPDHQKVLYELREKLQACYSISKILKQRFQQQKILIRKAQERIKNQTLEINNCKDKYAVERLDELETTKKKSEMVVMEQKRKVTILKDQVKTLTTHLEGCTIALEKSLETEEDRTRILKELEQLRSEHSEKQQLDENFYRHSEKIDVLTDQLHDAKNSLSQIKQDSMDNTLFTNQVIESFSSVSPGKKRRIQGEFKSPKARRSRVSLFRKLEITPSRDLVAKDLDPMSMNDEEFDKIFLPTKSSASFSSTKEERKKNERTSDRVVGNRHRNAKIISHLL